MTFDEFKTSIENVAMDGYSLVSTRKDIFNYDATFYNKKKNKTVVISYSVINEEWAKYEAVRFNTLNSLVLTVF